MKRYDLSIHTNLSILDGIDDLNTYQEYAKKNEIAGLAVTDRNSIYSYPFINQSDLKVIFGASLDMIDENLYNITLTPGKANLDESYYVVFDLETTGLTYDLEIIEIGAVKIYKGKIIDQFTSKIKPKGKISDKSIEITGITKESLENELSIEEVMPKFINFIGNAILVAHNANFDYHHLSKYLNKKYMVIDTLQLARTIYMKKIKRFYLSALCEELNISLDNAHSALCDASATAYLFMHLYEELKKKNISLYEEINTLVDKREMWKYMHPYPINVLVKDIEGYYNLLEIIQDGYNKHYYGDARFLKSIINKNRKGLLIGSGSYLGSLFSYSYEKSDDFLRKEISFYDYIEINPDDSYRHFYEQLGEDYLDIIHMGIKRVIKIAKELNKIVVATSNAYYSNENSYQSYVDNIKNPLFKRFNPLYRYNNIPIAHLRTNKEMESNFSYLENYMEYVYHNPKLIADMISFNKLPHHKDCFNDLSLPHDIKNKNDLILFINLKLDKSTYSYLYDGKYILSLNAKNQIFKMVKDIIGGNRVLIPSTYEFEGKLHAKNKNIPSLLGIISPNTNPIYISPTQYEIMEDKNNIKISHFPYDFYCNDITFINYEVNPYLTLLDELKTICKSNITDIDILTSSKIYKIANIGKYSFDLAWYRVYRPLLFISKYLDVLGIDDFILEEIDKEGFVLVNPNLNNSEPITHKIYDNKIVEPLNKYFKDDLALEIYESNDKWPISDIDDIIARFGNEIYYKYENIFKLLLEDL